MKRPLVFTVVALLLASDVLAQTIRYNYNDSAIAGAVLEATKKRGNFGTGEAPTKCRNNHGNDGFPGPIVCSNGWTVNYHGDGSTAPDGACGNTGGQGSPGNINVYDLGWYQPPPGQGGHVPSSGV